ncbi:MAG: ATP-binding protein [Fimbriiglobus sp.]|jgi:signal transduction histidine kinase|nr:ATP-binding protein [Fimbriiglobus sp.]
MSAPTGLPAGLAFLPTWLNGSKDPLAFDAALAAWCRATGWRTAGIVWPVGNPQLSVQVRDGVTEPAVLAPEAAEVLKTLQSGNPTVLWQLPGSCGRLYAPFQPSGRAAGLVWVERVGTDTWTDADRQYLLLSVALMERSPLLAGKVGPILDAERLQQRLNDASVIAGRMAHDFDNVLTGIIGFADLTVPLLPSGSQPTKFVQQIADVGKRGIVFTQQLHQLSRAGQTKPQPGVIAAALAKEEARLRPLHPAGFQLTTDVPAGLPAVGMEAGPLGVVVGHLLQNAVEAGGQPPRAAVSARLVELSAADAKGYLGAVRPGPHVEVRVTDVGGGIKPEVRARLFAEPFYTTKTRHRGLGLAVVYRTLHAHHGGIRLDPQSATDIGTSVRVVLPPAAVRPPVAASPTVITHASAFGG